MSVQPRLSVEGRWAGNIIGISDFALGGARCDNVVLIDKCAAGISSGHGESPDPSQHGAEGARGGVRRDRSLAGHLPAATSRRPPRCVPSCSNYGPRDAVAGVGLDLAGSVASAGGLREMATCLPAQSERQTLSNVRDHQPLLVDC